MAFSRILIKVKEKFSEVRHMRALKVTLVLATLVILSIVVGCNGDVTYPAGNPYIEAHVSQQAGRVPFSVGFKASVIGIQGAYTIVWNFGDNETASGNSVAHIYPDPGDYTATCMLLNEDRIGVAADWVHLTAYAQSSPPLIP